MLRRFHLEEPQSVAEVSDLLGRFGVLGFAEIAGTGEVALPLGAFGLAPDRWEGNR